MNTYRVASFFLLLAICGLTGCPQYPPSRLQYETEQYQAEIETWRSTRMENLKKLEGWLSLIGLHWLQEGDQSIGSAADNDILLSSGPDHFGILRLQAGMVSFVPAKAEPSILIEKDIPGVQASAEHDAQRFFLASDQSGAPSIVRSGTVMFLVIERGGKLGLRVKDSEAATRKQFSGIDYFVIDPGWRIEAQWTAHEEAKSFDIQTVIGTVEKMSNPGFASFSHDGHEYKIYPVMEPGSDELFIIFADRTNGRETYGAGRFLYAAMPVDGKLILDFNKAYNPPCAFNEYSTCPLPPPENRLDLRVTAGEKKYLTHR